MKAEYPGSAVVYTETVVFTPPEPLHSEAPYQIAIVSFADASRQTVRIRSKVPAQIGDTVIFLDTRDGVACYTLPEYTP